VNVTNVGTHRSLVAYTSKCGCTIRGASHYGWRLRGRRFPPIKLQETKSSASRSFTRRNLIWLDNDGLSKEVWVGWEWKPKLWLRRRWFLFIKNSIIDKILAVRLEGLFWARNIVDAPLDLDFGLSLWRLHTLAVQVERPWEFMANGLDFRLGLWRLHTMPSRRLHL
jgi:hypothetical protein